MTGREVRRPGETLAGITNMDTLFMREAACARGSWQRRNGGGSMTIKFLHAALLVAVLWTVAPAWAGGIEAAPEVPNADELIKACWDKSLELRSSQNTEDQREGHWVTAQCLRDQILENAKAMFIGRDQYFDEWIHDKLFAAEKGYGGFMWGIYNDHSGCKPFCGTIFHSFHNWELAKLYEHMLKTVIDQRKKYRL